MVMIWHSMRHRSAFLKIVPTGAADPGAAAMMEEEVREDQEGPVAPDQGMNSGEQQQAQQPKQEAWDQPCQAEANGPCASEPHSVPLQHEDGEPGGCGGVSSRPPLSDRCDTPDAPR